jgi:hypothetical protein
MMSKSAFFENHAKQKLAAGQVVLCMGLRQARTVDIAMIAAAAGFDSIYIDMEHSPVSLETTSLICASTCPIRWSVPSMLHYPPLVAHDPTATSNDAYHLLYRLIIDKSAEHLA